MESLVFGHAGQPILVFPTSMGSFFEYEDAGMIRALGGKLEAGAIQVFCVDGVDGESWYNKSVHPGARIWRHVQYERYVINEFLPYLKWKNWAPQIVVTGCSFGGYHALNFSLRHPDVVSSCVTMSGAFDIKSFLDGYYDDNCYFNNPPDYLPKMGDEWFLSRCRQMKIVLGTSDWDMCLDANVKMAGILHGKGIPHWLDIYGDNSRHDWPLWQRMAGKVFLVEGRASRPSSRAGTPGAPRARLRRGILIMANKKIGILFGMENTFPPALVEKINAMKTEGVTAEFVKIGGIRMDEPKKYDVIIDRISQDIPFYRAYLKNAMLQGTMVINNPFWWTADDKFFNYALAHKMGVAIPPTVILPHHTHPPDTTDQSMRNLKYPLNWEEVFAYVGFPAFLKPYSGGGWKHVYKAHSPEEFFHNYNQTGDLCMTLQHGVEFEDYYRCYVVGQEKVHIMKYDPKAPHHERYVTGSPQPETKLKERIEKDALALCRALGYDLNTVEFAVEDGVPYAIDFMNPAPDAEVTSVGQQNFEWIVDAVAEMAVEKALGGENPVEELRWAAFLDGPKWVEFRAPKMRKKA